VRILLRVRENSDRPAATDRGGGNRPSHFERFVEAAYLWVSRPTFFFICLAVVLVWLISLPLWTDLKEWQVAIHTVTSVTTLLLLALLENAARRSAEASQEKINMIAEALVALMTSPAVEDRDLQDAATKLREAIGLEERH
jgi:low affinity Fe/Cu permease